MTITPTQLKQIANVVVGASENAGGVPDRSKKIVEEIQERLLAVLPALRWEQFSEISTCAKQVLAVAYPKFAPILTQDLGLDTAGGGQLEFDRGACIQVLLIKILNGVESFDTSELRRLGAKHLASRIPSPVPDPTTPFDDVDPYMTFE
jgi:hypothetical protein